MVAFLIGLIYFGQELTEDGVMNINGALFIFLTNMTFQNVFAVITVSKITIIYFDNYHTNSLWKSLEINVFIFIEENK